MKLWRSKPTPNTDDIDHARREREQTERAVQRGHERWADVRRIVNESRQIRKVNHLADDLRAIFRG